MGPAGLLRIVAFMAVLAIAATAAAQPSPENAVSVELTAQPNPLEPGKVFGAAVVVQIKPGWHIYWKYPGDSGLPTRVSLEAPAGFEVGEPQWPMPDRFDLPGGIAGIGYHDRVVFQWDVKVLEGAPKSGRLTAKVKWLGCSAKLCVPGKSEIDLPLPVSPGVPVLPVEGQAYPIPDSMADEAAMQVQGTLATQGESKLQVAVARRIEASAVSLPDLMVVPPPGFVLVGVAPTGSGRPPYGFDVTLRAESPGDGPRPLELLLQFRKGGARHAISKRVEL